MDRVRLIPLERAELEDVEALQELIYEHLKRHTGQLLGAADLNGGLLSAPSPSLNTVTGALSFQSFAFCEIDEGSDTSDGTTRTPIAQVIRFDSGVTGHINHPVDTSAMLQGAIYGLFARAVTIESDSAPRRQFSTVTGLEEPLTMNTRERERVEFSLIKAPSVPAGDRWVKVLELTKGANGAVSSTAVSLWDDANAKAVNRLESRIPQIMLNTSELIDGTARENSHSLGLVEVLALIRGQLARILYYGAEDNDPIATSTAERWTDRPSISLAQLSHNLTDLQNDLNSEETTRASQVENLQRIKRIYARFYFRWTSTENTVNITLYDETGEAACYFDGLAIEGTGFSMGTVGISAADFIKCSKRPIIALDSNVNTWEVMSHNVRPVIASPYSSTPVPDSYATGTGEDREPIPFSYALWSNDTIPEIGQVNDLPEGLITSQGVEPAPTVPAPSLIPRYKQFRDGQGTGSRSVNRAVPFQIAVAPVAYGDNYSFTYDVMMTVRRA